MLRRFLTASRAFMRSFSTYGSGRWRADEDDSDWAYTETGSGVEVTRRKAYSVSHWYRAVNVISSTVAKTPIDVLDRTSGRQVPDKLHPAHLLLGELGSPNEDTLRFHFIQTLTAHAVGHGGGFAYITRDEYGAPIELWQLRPDRTWPVRENGRLMFVTSIGGDFGDPGATQRKLLAENVLHVHGMGWDGLTGYSLLDLAAESLGSTIAKEQFGAKFFRNAATPSVVIQVAKKMTDKALKNIKDSWVSMRTGLENAHKPVVLEDGAQLVPFSVTAADSQLIEAMERDPILIANFTGVPPYKLGVKGYNSYNSLEIMSQEFLDDTIDPWFVPWEEELERKLLTTDELARNTRCIRYRRSALIRVDAIKRSSIHRTELGGHPYRTPNEVRVEEGHDPLEGFDTIPSPMNMKAGQTGDPENKPAADPENPPDDPMAGQDAQDEALRTLWEDTATRMVRRIGTAVDRWHRRGDNDTAALEAEHRPVLRSAFEPLTRLSRTKTSADTISTEMIRSAVASVRAGQLTEWTRDTPGQLLAQLFRDPDFRKD